jgi:hypothetical protein
VGVLCDAGLARVPNGYQGQGAEELTFLKVAVIRHLRYHQEEVDDGFWEEDRCGQLDRCVVGLRFSGCGAVGRPEEEARDLVNPLKETLSSNVPSIKAYKG